MKPPIIVGFDSEERTVTLQFADDIRQRGFAIGAQFGCARNQNSTQFCYEAEEKSRMIDQLRAESAGRGLTLATLCDMLLGEDATDRSDDALVRAAMKMKRDRDTAREMLDPWRASAAECAKESCARKALQEEVARLNTCLLQRDEELRARSDTITQLRAELESVKRGSAKVCRELRGKTCIHHTDTERASAGCPVCLQADVARLREDFASHQEIKEQLVRERAELREEISKHHSTQRGSMVEQVADIAESTKSYQAALKAADAEVARLQMELDGTCNAEELRQVRADNARLREALDPETILAAEIVPGGSICDPQTVADNLRAYCHRALAEKEQAP